MRSESELEKAHGILQKSMEISRVDDVRDAQKLSEMTNAYDLLCWVLHHKHKTHFADNLAIAKRHLRDLGYTGEDLDELQ